MSPKYSDPPVSKHIYSAYKLLNPFRSSRFLCQRFALNPQTNIKAKVGSKDKNITVGFFDCAENSMIRLIGIETRIRIANSSHWRFAKAHKGPKRNAGQENPVETITTFPVEFFK
jgi:hypothetical protein